MGLFKSKEAEAESEKTNVPDQPPPYSEHAPAAAGASAPNYGPTQNQHEQRPISGNHYGSPQQYDPMQDPNVYKIQPNLVNITQAPPQHLNPSYQQYLARDQERIKQGDFPKPAEQFKHGAPLNPGHASARKGGSSSFPGRAGATYNDAANR